MGIIENYLKAKQELYDHVGFVKNWIVCPIEDETDMFWQIINNESVRFAETEEKFNSDGDYYEDEIYTQRFYKKHVYRGEEYTMIFCNPGVDGMKWFRIFSNDKEIKE